MEISSTLVWLLVGLVLCGTEMLVGTFYLLVLALGCFSGALFSWFGFPFGWQCVVFSVVAVVGGLCVYRLRLKRGADEGERLQNLDVGQSVTVERWNEDMTATVEYRGAQWIAVALEGTQAHTGPCTIVRVDGSRLVVK